MPYVANGIGTIYIGRKNLREYRATCENCGRHTILRDYQTRAWFTLIVPILPLGRKQILGFCPACTSHMALPVGNWAEFNEHYIQDTTAKLAADPTNIELSMSLLNSLSEVGRDEEAARLAGQVRQTFATDPDALCQLAGWYGWPVDQAESIYAQAVALDPNHRDAAIGLAAVDIDKGRPDRAHGRLRSLDTPDDPIDPQLKIALADAYQKRDEHDAALAVLKEVLAAHREAGTLDYFRKMVRTSEKAAAGEGTILPRRPIRPKRLALAAIAVLLVAALVGLDHYVATHRPVYLANGLADPINAGIHPDQADRIDAYAARQVTIGEGDHHVVIHLADGTRHEQGFTLDGVFIRRIFSRPTCVLNVLGTAAIVEQKLWYSANAASTRQPSFTLHTGAELIVLPKVDYLFQDMPDTISLDRNRDTSRTGLVLLEGDPIAVGDWAMATDTTMGESLLTYHESHLQVDPNNAQLLADYISLSATTCNLPRCRDFIATLLADRPIRLHWHRAYQSVCEHTGQVTAAVRRYERLLADDPDNPQLLYLTGKLQAYNTQALDYVQRTIEADPAHAFAWVAKAYHLQSRGQFVEAERAARKAVDLDPAGGAADDRLNSLLLALGRHGELTRYYRQALVDSPLDRSAHLPLMATLVSAGDTDGARAAHARYAATVDAEPHQDVYQLKLLSELALHGLLGDYDTVRRRASELTRPEALEAYQFDACLAAGQLDDAVASGSGSRLELNWPHQLAIAVAAHAQGRSDMADTWRSTAIKTLSQRGLADRAAAEMLGRPTEADPDRAEDLAMEPADKALLLVALVQAGGDRRLLDLAEKLNYSPDTPHKVIAGAIKHARGR